LSPDSFEFSSTRETDRVEAVASWSDGSETNVTSDCIWGTDDATIVLAVNGVVHPLNEGNSRIWCTVKGKECSADVSVASVAAPKRGELAFNEALADVPPSTDVNGDGNGDTTQDEFVEIVNAGEVSVTLAQTALWDSGNDTARHSFAADAVLAPGEAIVVFGGGTARIKVRDHCSAVVADNEDDGLQHGLALNNDGDTIRLLDKSGSELAKFTYSGEVSDAAYVLDPEIDGSDYVSAEDSKGSTGAFSPCTLANGDEFPGPEGRF
jgi:hypothetical protein